SPHPAPTQIHTLSLHDALPIFNANGGWVEGDESFTGPIRPTDAFITYYQKRRHIFGDLKIEIFDQEGKLLDTIAGSKHRGLNRRSEEHTSELQSRSDLVCRLLL